MKSILRKIGLVFFLGNIFSSAFAGDLMGLSININQQGKMVVDKNSPLLAYLSTQLNYALLPTINFYDGRSYFYDLESDIANAVVGAVEMKDGVIKSVTISFSVVIGLYEGGGSHLASGEGICYTVIKYPAGVFGAPLIDCEPLVPFDTPLWPEDNEASRESSR